MPTFVYFRAQNKLGYGYAVHYTTMVDGNGKSLNNLVFQSHKITADEALMGMETLSKKYKIRVRIKAKVCVCNKQLCLMKRHCEGEKNAPRAD